MKTKVDVYLMLSSNNHMKKNIKGVLFFCMFLSCNYLGFSQDDKQENLRLLELDSLSSSNVKNDSLLRETIKLAKNLKAYDIAVKHSANLIKYFNYETSTKEKGLKLVSETKPLLTSVKNKEIVSRFYFEVADLHYYLGEFEDSVKNYDSSFFYANNNVSLKGLSRFGKGIVYVDNGEFGKASLALQEAIAFFQEDKDTLNWLNAKNSMTILYGKNGFYNEEAKERDEILELVKTYKNFPSLPLIYYNAAASTNKLNQQKKRISYLKKAISVNENSEYKDFFKPIFQAGLAVAYAQNDSLSKAKELIDLLEKNKDNTTGFNRAFYLDAKKQMALAQKKYNQAIDYGLDYLKLKQSSQEYEEIQEAESFLSKAYKLIGDNNQALKHFEKFTELKDSISNIQKTRVLSYYQTLYETEKRDLKIASQKQDIDLLEAQKKIQTQWVVFGSLVVVFVFIFLSVLRSKKFAKKAQKQQELFSQHILASQEQERNKVAMELHDSVGQQLMLLTRRAKNSEVSTLQELAAATLANLRAVSHNLYPVVLKRLGFSQAAQELVNSVDENSDVFFTTEIANVDDKINEEQSLHLFRILQEALQNIIKHAKAKSVIVEVNNLENKIELKIEDNGIGFNYKEVSSLGKSLGVKSIEERCKMINANLIINSKLGEGTTLKVILQH